MCGIFSLSGNGAPVRPESVTAALDSLRPRGPDGEGRWFSADGRQALGHRRLGIVDLAGGAQPLHSEDGRIHIVVNGEFYGHDDIRAGLTARGHVFATRSDSEVALHLYEEYGPDFLRHLRGEFALVLYDETRGRLLAARDRFGIKPLCYAESTDGFCIASEAKAIMAAGIAPAWDRLAAYHACTLQYAPESRTFFSGIRQLPAGHMLVREKGATRITRYWDTGFVAAEIPRAGHDAEWIDGIKHHLQEAVRLRLAADVPVCAHLSGGINSSSIAALAAEHMARAPDCFTVRFAGGGAYDEYPVAQEMAARIGATLHVVDIDGDDIADHLSDAVYGGEGLAINHHLAGKYLLNRAIAAAGYKVALSGEGADETLLGYPHFREDMLDAGDAPARAALYAGNTMLAGVFLAEGDALDLHDVARRAGFVPAFLHAKATLGARLHALLDPGFRQDMQAVNPYAELVDANLPAMAGLPRAEAASHLWIKSALQTYILRVLGDGCEMPHAVEGRVPFLDHRLFEYCRAMPLHLKIRGATEKYVLREAMRPYLTETLYRRQKQPFIAPPSQQLMSPRLRALMQDSLRGPDLPAFFDRRAVAGWLDALDSADDKTRITAEPALMMMLTASLLQKRYGLAA